MFKTVKVGDTSLQYTIVSQTEESSCSSSGGTTTTRKNKIKRKTRHRQTVILILITLIMGCGIVIAAVLVPILVASKLVGNLPESAKFQTFAIAASSIQGYGKHDQNGHKYVELLPIKQAPVDSVIEFRDDIPVMEDNKWRTDFRLNFNDAKSSKEQLPSAAAESVDISDKPSVSNFTQVTVYHNKSENVTAFPQHISPTIESQSSWRGLIRLLKTLIDFVVQKRITPVIQLACLMLIVVMAILIIKYRRRKRRIEKVESYEHKAQRKQLLSAIPIEDD